MKSWLFLRLIGLAAIGVSAKAAPAPYTINFVTYYGAFPASGSFEYDSATATFSSFTVTWDGLTFDFLSEVNAPFTTGLCDTGSAGGTGLDAFNFLSDPTCGTGSIATNTGWRASSTFSNASFEFYRDDPTGSFVFGGIPVTPLNSNIDPFLSAGTMSISPAAATPEPGTSVLLLLGLAARLAWKRQRPTAL